MRTHLSTFISCFCLALAFTLLAGCSKDDAPAPGNGGSGGSGGGGNTAFSATVNGNAFQPAALLVAGALANSGGPYGITASGITMANGDTTTVIITMWGPDFNTLAANAQFTGQGTPLDSMSVGFVKVHNGSPVPVEADSQDNQSGTATITAIDKVAKHFSGTFAFTAVDPNTSEAFVVTNGVFTEVAYD